MKNADAIDITHADYDGTGSSRNLDWEDWSEHAAFTTSQGIVPPLTAREIRVMLACD